MSIPQEGVLKIGLKNGRLQKQGLFMKGKKVSKVFQDREGTIWFSTLNDGVYALPKNAVLTYSKIHDPFFKSDNFTALNILPDGTLAAGDDSGNLYFRKNGVWTIQKVGSNDGYNRVRQILPLPGNDWMAVSDELVFSKERGAFKVLVDGVRNQGASKFAYHGEGVTWLANSYNLLNWSKDPGRAQILKNSRTSAVGADAEGNIWAGGLNGLFSQKDTFKMSWGDRFVKLGSRIIAIEQAGDNALWVATPDYGLLRVYVSKGEVTTVEEVNLILKKPIENIQSIFTEPDGKVWLATNKGVFALSDDYEVSHFDQKNGLANNDVNAVVVDGDTLWAATVAGLSQMLLRQSDEEVDFPTLFTALRYEIGDQKFAVDLLDTLAGSKKITLPPGTSLLELTLTALQYRGGGGFQFEFMTTEKLLPFSRLTFGNIVRAVSQKFGKHCEKDFVEGSTWNYGTHVSPGRYHLTATAVLQGGVLSNQPDEWTITVLPSWWETIWFIFLVLGLVAYVIWRLVRAALAYRKLEAAASQLQLQAIKAQINPHFIGNSINAIQQFFYPPDPVKASKYISIFSGLLRRTMFFSEKNFIPFIDEVGYVKDYLEMIQLRFGDGFSFQINGADKVPPETPFPAMVLQPVLENATIHGRSPLGESFLKVEFLYENGRLTCLITDNGVGINTSLEKKRASDTNRHSKGLSLLKEKVQMLNSLYALDLRLSLKEITENEAEQGGTQAEISFNPPKQSEIPQRN